MNRKLAIAINVVLFHIAALWLLQSGLLRHAVEIVVPAQVLSEFVNPPAPPQPPPPPPPAKSRPPLRAPAPAPAAVPPAEPAAAPSVAAPSPAPSILAPPSTAAPAPLPVAVPAPAPAPARVEQPSSDAAYLNNPKPAYPALSRRLGEQGKVVLRVLIGADGTAQRAEIQSSSGYERLDQAALATVLKWRYVPGKRGGVPETMWFNVPISFVLE